MEDMNRRSALALGLTAAAAAPLFVSSASAATPVYGPEDGKELFPGVRLVEIGEFHSDIPAYKSIFMVDIVFQPGAADVESVMDNDMVCFILAGEFKINKVDKEFTVKEGESYTCSKGKTDHATNISSVVGIHRASVLIPA